MTDLKTTSRLTALAYLGLAVSGMVAFLLVRQELYVPQDASATLANLQTRDGLARLGVAADLTVVLTQALAALCFFRLFRHVSAFAAGAVAALGLVNATIILVATVFSATALQVALAAETAAPGDRAATAQLLYDLNGSAWDVGGLFFGLWLLPMGWLVWRSGTMPRLLGWVLVVGGIGYVVSTYLTALVPDASWVSAVSAPATVGELWIIVHLLWKGPVPAADAPAHRPADVVR